MTYIWISDFEYLESNYGKKHMIIQFLSKNEIDFEVRDR